MLLTFWTNKLECFYTAKVSSLSASTEYQLDFTLRERSKLIFKYWTRQKRISNGKHTSLFFQRIGDEEKESYIICIDANVIKLLHSFVDDTSGQISYSVFTQREFSVFFVWILPSEGRPELIFKYWTSQKRIFKGKHTSLFLRRVGSEEKESFIIDPVIKLIFVHGDAADK